MLEQYDREQYALRRYLTFLGLKIDAAEEIVQEAFLRLHRHLKGNGDRGNLRAWLYRVAHNLARNEQSAAHRRLCDSIDSTEPSHTIIWTGGSPESAVLEQERDRSLRKAIESLSDSQRACLVLRAQGMKYREIAEVLGLSVSTVGENLRRGLQNVKDSL